LLAREIEKTGISTVTINLIPEIARIVKIPRVACLPFPLGSPMGNPKNEEKQIQILRSALSLLERDIEPGSLVSLPYKWKE